MKRVLTCVVLSAILMLVYNTMVSAQRVSDTRSRRRQSTNNGEPKGISLIALLATPERFDGRIVRLQAVMRNEFEWHALFLHLEDYERQLSGNSVNLNLTKEQQDRFRQFNGRYVILEGVVVAHDHYPNGKVIVLIDNITRVEEWPIK